MKIEYFFSGPFSCGAPNSRNPPVQEIEEEKMGENTHNARAQWGEETEQETPALHNTGLLDTRFPIQKITRGFFSDFPPRGPRPFLLLNGVCRGALVLSPILYSRGIPRRPTDRASPLVFHAVVF